MQLKRATAGKIGMQRVDISLDPDIALGIARCVLTGVNRRIKMQLHIATFNDGVGAVRAHDFYGESEDIAVICDGAGNI